MKQRPSDPFANPSTPFPSEAERIHASGLRPEKITDVPRCASGLPLASWRALVVAMNDALHTRVAATRFCGDHFRALSSDGAMLVLYLDKLALRCRAHPVDAIRAEVEAHVARVLALRPVLASKAPPPFAEAAPRLLAQVYRADGVPPGPGTAVVRPLCAGLVTMLALDLGPAITTVSPAWCEAWGQPDDALLRLGVENLRRRAVHREPLMGGVPGFMLTAEDIALSAQVHHLASHLDAVPRAGALVALPTRSLLLCVPLGEPTRAAQMRRVHETVVMLRALQVGLADIAPEEPVFSRDLYWWRAGEMRTFSLRFEGQHALLTPPAGFEAALTEPHRRSVN